MIRLPILAGPLRGAWWLPASGGKLLRMLGGTYEPAQSALFQEHLRSGDTVFDIGAHHGYYSLLASRLAGSEGRVIAFEPNPANARFLRRHVAINRCRNVRVVEAAVSDTEGSGSFELGTGSGTGRLARSGELDVGTTTIDGVVEIEGDPQALKIDVEGAEEAVLIGAERTLLRARPTIFLSTHGDDVRARCLRRLRALDYLVEPIGVDDPDAASELLCLPG